MGSNGPTPELEGDRALSRETSGVEARLNRVQRVLGLFLAAGLLGLGLWIGALNARAAALPLPELVGPGYQVVP